MSNDTPLNAYYISFQFTVSYPQPGTLMTLAADEEKAKEVFMEHMKQFSDVTIHQIMDVSEVEALKDQVDEIRALQQEADDVEEPSTSDDTDKTVH